MNEERGQFAGLMTAIAGTLASSSALRVADNVVIRRLGAVEPRHGYTPFDEPSITRDHWQSATLGAGQIYEAENSWYAGSSLIIFRYPGSSTNYVPHLRVDAFSSAAARGNLYIASDYGVLKSTDTTSAGLTLAGLVNGVTGIRDIPVINVNPDGPLPPTSHFSYRLIYRRIDANQMEYVSAPSGATEVINLTANQSDVSFFVELFYDMGPLDTIELYRTRAFPNTVTLDDEHQLIAKLSLKDADIVIPGFVLFSHTDLISEIARGASLYTSPGQGGIESKNDAPPACGFVEPHKGVMFFGNVRGPQRFVISYNYDGSGVFGPPSYISTDDGVGTRQYTGNVTNLSTTFQVTSGTTGLRKGQAVVGVGSSGANPLPYITDISGTTVTVNIPMPYATGVGVGIYIDDAIIVNGEAYALDYGGELLAATINENGPTTGLSASKLTPPDPGATATIVIETILRQAGSFSIYASHGDEYIPAISNDPNAPDTSVQDVYPNGLQWSKPDQPESVPPSNYVLLGDKKKALLNGKSTRDALFLFKEDGILRLSGVYGSWQIDPFDLTTLCVLPSSVVKLDGRIYALTNRGVVAVDDSGVQVVSEPIHDQVARIVADCIQNYRTLGYYKITGVPGVAATVDAINGEYMLLTGDVPLEFGGNMLVFNARTDSWTTASFAAGADFAGFTPTGLGLSGYGEPLILHYAGKRAPLRDLALLDGELAQQTYDGAAHVNVVLATLLADGVSAQYQYSPGTYVVAGDVMQLHDGTQLRVLSQPSSSAVIVALLTPGVVPASDTLVFYRPFTCAVQPHGYLQSRPVNKLWTRVFWTLERFLGPNWVEAVFSSAGPLQNDADQEAAQPAEQLAFVAPSGFSAHHAGALLQGLVPRAHARSWLVRAKLRWSAAFSRVSLETVGMESRDNAPNRTQQASGSTT